MIRILGRSSSINVRKVLWTCDELGLAYTLEPWGSGFRSTDDDAFRALNPNALVPVLVDDDFVLWESNAIVRYLARRQRATRLLPDDPASQARVEQWMDWQAGELNNAWRYAFMGLVRRSPAHADASAIAASVAAWNRHMGLVDAQLARTGGWMTGPDFTLADIVIGLSANRWRMTPMGRPALPAVERFHARLLARDGYRRHGANGTP